MANYRFDCGCEWPVLGGSQDGCLPLLDFDVEKAPQDCPATWEILAKGMVKGFFQLEKTGKRWVKRLRPTEWEHMSALGAILRPGCTESEDDRGVSMTELYCCRKNGEEEVKPYHPVVDKVLEEFYGCLIYQESSMELAKQVAGFNLQEADQLRKCVAGDTMFVSKTRGWISIDRLLKEGYEDDLYLTMDDNGVQSWKGLEKIWSTGRHDVRTVCSASGFTLRATKHHQFLTDHGWKARSRLVPKEDYLIATRQISYEGADRISSDLALVVVGIEAEGHFIEGRSTFVNHDPSMMDKFLTAYRNEFGNLYSINTEERVVVIPKEVRLQLEPLVGYGLSDSRKLPDVMMGMTKESTRRFLSYVLACEGGVSETGNFEFSSKSPVFSAQVKALLLRFGVRSLFKSYPESERYRLFVNDVEDQKVMLRELTGEWPRQKVEALERVTTKRISQFTTDIFPSHIVRKLLDQYPSVVKPGETGRIYSQPLSRIKFSRFAELSGDSYWTIFALGSQCCDELVSVEELTRQVITYDFTVAGGNTPYIVANGMVIHNSIGKKDPVEMSRVKILFSEGAAKAGVLSKSQAEEVFNWIEKSQRYQFNRAHSLCYGILGYDSAYIKAHFPLAFYSGWLYLAREKQKPFEEISELVAEAKLFDIPVLCPDLRDLQPRFYPSGKAIKFGMTDIRGVGEAQVDMVLTAAAAAQESLGRPLGAFSWYHVLTDVFSFCYEATASALIQAGALSWLGMPRQEMLAECQAWFALTDKERDWVRGRNPSPQNLQEALCLAGKIKKEGGAAHDKRRVSAIRSQLSLLESPPTPLVDTPLWISWIEQLMLGVSISCVKIDSCDLSQVNVSCKEYLAGRKGFLVFGVEVKRAREITTKRGQNPGRKMAFLTVADASCSLDEVVCFPDVWEETSSLLKEGNTVIIQGERSEKPKDNTLHVKKVWQAN